MQTLQQDIDDLDRMVEGGSPQDKIRSQIRLVAREVAALETDYAALLEAHTNLQKAQAEGDAKATQAMDDALRYELRKQSEARKRRTLHYG